MDEDKERDPMIDIFVYETEQLIEKLEQIILESEEEEDVTPHTDEIFRIMHTIKGSSAMMEFHNISDLSHKLEDLFSYIRKNKSRTLDYSKLADIVFESIDFIKEEIDKINQGKESGGQANSLIRKTIDYLDRLENVEEANKIEDDYNDKIDISLESDNSFEIHIRYEDDCEMVNIRAFSVVHNIKEIGDVLETEPRNLEDDNTSEKIKDDGLKVKINSNESIDKIRAFINKVPFIKEFKVLQYEENKKNIEKIDTKDKEIERKSSSKTGGEVEENKIGKRKHSRISVDVDRLDNLMNLVGELVIAESMVTQNPDLKNLHLENFNKSAMRLKKIILNLQDEVMATRMVSLSQVFKKMKRVVRDISKKTNKEIGFITMGEETEVDKNIVEYISDPLLHLIRNAIDHGIESPEERMEKGKEREGKIILSAKNLGGDVEINIIDDGKGLDKEKIIEKALEKDLITEDKIESIPNKEIYSFIFKPGFSTKDKVSEFSGRGVGMDVAFKNIEKIRGAISVDSNYGMGTKISIKIPLTLGIIDGMIVRVGDSTFTIPTKEIKQSINIGSEDVIKDTEGNEMLLIRGTSYSIIRLGDFYDIKRSIKKINEGIIIVLENDRKNICLFVDEVLEHRQVVIKQLPNKIKKVRGIAGCTLLGDGSISLILDVSKLTDEIL